MEKKEGQMKIFLLEVTEIKIKQCVEKVNIKLDTIQTMCRFCLTF